MLLLLILFVGIGVAYLLWPKNNGELPVLHKVEEIKLKSVFKDTYMEMNDSIKVVTFFYTKCPDICPLTMLDMQKLQNKLKEQKLFGREVKLVSITLDPMIDDEATIKKYAESFDVDPHGWRWLRGTVKEVEDVANQYQMYAEKLDSGFVAHSTKLYLVDGQERIRARYDMANGKESVDVEKIMEDILLLLDK